MCERTGRRADLTEWIKVCLTIKEDHQPRSCRITWIILFWYVDPPIPAGLWVCGHKQSVKPDPYITSSGRLIVSLQTWLSPHRRCGTILPCGTPSFTWDSGPSV